MYPAAGYYYCDFLLQQGKAVEAYEHASQTIVTGRKNNWLVPIALDALTLGRATAALILWPLDVPQTKASLDGLAALTYLDSAVDGLRAAGKNDFVPFGLLARAALRRSLGHWGGAERDLEEVEEIAEPGPMRLYLCDMAFERARLALAKIEAFAPLNGMLERDNPPKPTVPSGGEIVRLKTEAEEQLKIAADCIEKCGYHRRDEELAELQAVLRGERAFASLPPRV